MADVRIAFSVDASLPAVLGLFGAREQVSAEPRAELVGLADGTRALLCDPWDVSPLVERGVVTAGVLPKHVLAEIRPDVYEVLDLRVGRERLVLVAPPDRRPTPSWRRARIATTHPRLTQAYFAARGVQVETLAVRQAADATVLLGAADAAVLSVLDTDEDDRPPSGLIVRETVMASSARLIVNRSARATRGVELGVLVDRLRQAVRSGDPDVGALPGRTDTAGSGRAASATGAGDDAQAESSGVRRDAGEGG